MSFWRRLARIVYAEGNHLTKDLPESRPTTAATTNWHSAHDAATPPMVGQPNPEDPEIAKHYNMLELPYGAPWPAVKNQYRHMIRKYHPDQHTQSPARHEAATKLTQQLHISYNYLRKRLENERVSGKK